MQAAPLTRAFTLIEVLVGSALAFLVLGLFISVLLPTIRYSVRIQSRSQMQASCAFAMQQIRNDLQTTNAGALAYVNFGPNQPSTVLAFQPLDIDLSGNTPLYVAELVCYSWFQPDASLVRRHWLAPPPIAGATFSSDQPLRLDIVQLKSLRDLVPQPPDNKVVCPSVLNLTISSSVDPPQIGNPLHLRLVVQKQTAAGELDNYALEQSVFLRNSK